MVPMETMALEIMYFFQDILLTYVSVNVHPYVDFSGAAMDFSPRVNFQCRFSYFVRTPLV